MILFFLQLMGNPSDGFYGKTISLSIQNFWAEVTIYESEKLILTPHPLCDPTEFGSLADLHDSYGRDGYLGGLRLLQATCRKFYQYCSKHGIALAKRNFTLKYDTNIPRQVRKWLLILHVSGFKVWYVFALVFRNLPHSKNASGFHSVTWWPTNSNRITLWHLVFFFTALKK